MMLLLLLFSLIARGLASVEENIGVDDPNLFEGDMILTPEQRQAAMTGGDVSTAGARGSIKSRHWTGGVMHYTIDSSLASSTRAMAAIQAGMKMWEDNTCIKFVKRTNQRNYAHFYKGGGCSSYVGMTGGKQKISLAGGCWQAGTVAHEIGHALGFYHEQSRPDRDNYVEIIWANIMKGAGFNFKKYSASTIDSLGTPYDYGSIMHYHRTAFGRGKETIRPKKSGVTIGNRKYISKMDIQQMNLLYKCQGGGGGATPSPSTKPPQTQLPPTTGFSVCYNHNKTCEEWANQGKCEKNPNYMVYACRKSCGICGNARCNNYHFYCEKWAQTNACKTHKPYMSKWCRKACKFCKVATPAPSTQPPQTQPPPTTGFTVCYNHNKSCEEWAKKGECTKNPNYMVYACRKSCGICGNARCNNYHNYCEKWAQTNVCKTHKPYMSIWCRKACKFCKVATPAPSTQPPQTQPPPTTGFTVCYNHNKSCEEWAKKGECTKNPNYMVYACRKSCGICGNERCNNYHNYCEKWAQTNVCKTHKPFMSKWCRKACKFCKAPGTPAPTLPPFTVKPGACGAKPNVRIVGGTEAPKNAWPWQAMLTTKWGGQFCGGTLIDPMWVLSASHCLVRSKPDGIKIRMGAHYKYGSTIGTEQNIKVEKIILHPSYHKPKRYAHDIALIKLASPARLNNAVGLACLPSDGVVGFVPGKKCWITGWGRLASGGNRTNVLMQASVPIKSDADCKKSYPGRIHDSMVCAGLDQGGIDTCQGDSGGPMVCEHSGKFYIEGVTSWGYGCARPGKFGVYSDVRYSRSWILQTMANN